MVVMVAKGSFGGGERFEVVGVAGKTVRDNENDNVGSNGGGVPGDVGGWRVVDGLGKGGGRDEIRVTDDIGGGRVVDGLGKGGGRDEIRVIDDVGGGRVVDGLGKGGGRDEIRNQREMVLEMTTPSMRW
ncbi:ctenidin-3-like [Benincasa hispida]|uniref:ctenidin-3-like n=1 Tax=Benincasa hispida TaxID=102211 RepID=UPI001900F09E|nr:ctenidin-3-like [Benincasa hispida]